MSPISFISTPPVIGLPSYLFKSILLEIQFLYNIWRYPYSWPGSSIFIFAVLLGFHCYKSVFPSISVWQDGSSIGRIDLPSSQKVVESTLGRMAPKKAWQDIGPMPEEATKEVDWPAHAHAHGQIVHVWNETQTFSYQLVCLKLIPTSSLLSQIFIWHCFSSAKIKTILNAYASCIHNEYDR